MWSLRLSHSGSITFSRHCSERFDAVPFFWSQHYDVTIAYVGRLMVVGEVALRTTLPFTSPWLLFQATLDSGHLGSSLVN